MRPEENQALPPSGQTGLDDDASDDLSLGELLFNFWEGRYLFLGSIVVLLAMGIFYIWQAAPTYQATAMLQIEAKKVGSSDAAFTRIRNMFSEPTEGRAEVEILRSNLVLGRAVESLSLDVISRPILVPIVGPAMVRDRPDAPFLKIRAFEIPEHLKRLDFRLQVLQGGTYAWQDAKGRLLTYGRVGEPVTATFRGATLKLEVSQVCGKVGQRFMFARKPLLRAIGDLRKVFTASEKGKGSNILILNLMTTDPYHGAEILNEIVGQYIAQNIERKAEEASKTLAFLKDQMPLLQGKLEAAENHLNQYRMHTGSVDLPQEVQLLLKQSVDIESQRLTLQQRRQDLLRTYQSNADVVNTLNGQLQKLESEGHDLDRRLRSLPTAQQEVVRLSRDVQVNTELYTSLLNNMQQLQIVKAGEVGNAHVVDRATPPIDPVQPKKSLIITISLIAGVTLGLVLAMIRRALHRGVEDHRLIETKLGLPVLVTIPHSQAQDDNYQAIRDRIEGFHLLAAGHPEDLATESLRSLRTTLHFTMIDAPNTMIMVAGPSPSIGKSFVSSNLAAVLAQAGAKVLLVDGDLRRGGLHHYFGNSSRDNGLSEILSGQLPWRKALRKSSIENLDFISTGAIPPNPSELLMSPHFLSFCKETDEAYDFVIMDAPPLLSVTDAFIIGKQVGTVLLLVKSGQHSLDEIKTCQRRFAQSGIRLKGCVFNDVMATGLGYKYRYYRYAYHYQYKK